MLKFNGHVVLMEITFQVADKSNTGGSATVWWLDKNDKRIPQMVVKSMVMNPMAESVTKIPEKQVQEEDLEQLHITGINKENKCHMWSSQLTNIFHMEIPIRESYSPLGTE